MRRMRERQYFSRMRKLAEPFLSKATRKADRFLDEPNACAILLRAASQEWQTLKGSNEFKPRRLLRLISMAFGSLATGFVAVVAGEAACTPFEDWGNTLLKWIAVLAAASAFTFLLLFLAIEAYLILYFLLSAFSRTSADRLARLTTNVRDFRESLALLDQTSGIDELQKSEFVEEVRAHLVTYYAVLRNNFLITTATLVVWTPIAFAGIYLAGSALDGEPFKNFHDHSQSVNLYCKREPTDRLAGAVLSAGTVMVTMGLNATGCWVPDLTAASQAFICAIGLMFSLGIGLNFYLDSGNMNVTEVEDTLRNRLSSLQRFHGKT